MFKEMAQLRPQDAINQLDRQDQSLIFQFRMQHTKTNKHLNGINPQHQPHCRHCDNPAETTEHLLLYCPNLQLKRNQLLPTNPTIHSILYGQLDQLKKTTTFIRLALTVQEWRTQHFGINNNSKQFCCIFYPDLGFKLGHWKDLGMFSECCVYLNLSLLSLRSTAQKWRLPWHKHPLCGLWRVWRPGVQASFRHYTTQDFVSTMAPLADLTFIQIFFPEI